MLNRAHSTLPSSYYHDPEHYQRELAAIWRREWICIGRASEWPNPGDFRVVRLGDQQIVVTRNQGGALKAFHNTCRHRGSLLCADDSGRFEGGRIVCPYHAWVYSLDGDLQRTPRRVETPDFDPAAYSLYRAHLDTWGGFVFLNLSVTPRAPLADAMGEEARELANWPLEKLGLAHREMHEVKCNWKVFWENFLECYHCPGIHPDLCRLVPVYGEGLSSLADLPESSALRKRPGPLAPGAVTWSKDGRTPLPCLEGLGATEQAAGMTFATFLPGVFIVGHVDHVRSVHVLPLGPERTQLTVNWLLQPETLATGEVDIPRLTGFGNRVVMEDARACELNQQGLKCRRHEHGVLVPQEYDVLAFDNWVRKRLDSLAPASA